MTTATEALPTPKKIEQMSDHERLVALRLLDRRKSKVSKLWNGKVSEARTSAEHLVEAEVPKRDAECRQRLEAIGVTPFERTVGGSGVAGGSR